jgi:hypothetical protein
MSAAKKKSESRPLLPPAALLSAAAAILIVLGGYWTWRTVGPRVLDSPEYRLDLGQVEITPPPDWAPAGLCAEVFRDPLLSVPLRITDADLAERIYAAFGRNPWVAKVRRVSVHNPARVRVELDYRRPACMVELPGGLLPVDAEGYILPPEDFTPVEAARWPRLAGVERRPTLPPGQRWTDARVVGGAEIAAALTPHWNELKLHRILPLAADAGQRMGEPRFELLTRGGSRIRWGYAPGAGVLGELPAAEKIARLRRLMADNDTLDGRDGKPQELDIRDLPPATKH